LAIDSSVIGSGVSAWGDVEIDDGGVALDTESDALEEDEDDDMPFRGPVMGATYLSGITAGNGGIGGMLGSGTPNVTRAGFIVDIGLKLAVRLFLRGLLLVGEP
jgi:hypothetical protein